MTVTDRALELVACNGWHATEPMARKMAAELLDARRQLAALNQATPDPAPPQFPGAVEAFIDETFVHDTDPDTGELRLPGMQP